jgi:hypothetical protein
MCPYFGLGFIEYLRLAIYLITRIVFKPDSIYSYLKPVNGSGRFNPGISTGPDNVEAQQ